MADIKPRTGMIIDGVFASEAIDSSGEVVEISGMDITTFEEGNGVANIEHLDESAGFGQEIVGKIIFARKIFKESDCEDDRQKGYWEKLKGIPFLYGVVRLYDGAGHAGAQALAAQIRDHVANEEPVLVKFSIEGTTLEKEGHRIKSSIAKKVACTIRPCNKTAVSGLIADPNAPDGFKKNENSLCSTEVECSPVVDGDPAFRLLAAVATFRAIHKSLSAGTTDAAPSTLTGGAALQREDFVKGLKNQALAALRDYGDKPFRRHEFKAFAKAKLPEVSESFLDHFADVAEAYTVKKSLAKALPKVAAIKAPKTEKVSAPKVAKQKAPAVVIPAKHQATNHAVLEDIADEDEDMPDELLPKGNHRGRKIANGTFRGIAMKPNPGIVRPTFDIGKGVLHTPVGSFKAYLPQHDGPEAAANYQKILAHPDIEKAMDHAMTNWSRVHKLLKSGKLPPEVIMHAVMFAQLSPNKPVPTQEVQYARLVDAMDATGIDPRHPGFEQIEDAYTNLDHPNRLPHVARDEFARNPAYYQGGKVGVEHDAAGQKVGKPSAETGRYPGELLSGRPLFQDFLGRASKYHTLHESVVDLARRHRHDVMGAISEMMDSKRAAGNWANTRRSAIKAGKPDPGEFKGIAIPGLKVKTGLYTWGMLGGGNSMVPDTHFVRNAYGLDVNKDSQTIEYLKQMHWRPTNMANIIAPFNKWYAANHPAVQYTLNHPKWGSTFEKPEDALFPAFWRHWLTIAPHERALGLPNYSEQAGTTHAPFWDAIRPHVDEALGKTEDHDCSTPLRTAMVHQQYVKDYGEVPALMMFYHHLVPKLLEVAEHRQRVGTDLGFLAKANALKHGLVELRKNISDVLDGHDIEAPEVHKVELRVNGKLHPAGRFMLHQGHLHHLEDYHGILASMLPEGPLTAETISRLHGLQHGGAISSTPHPAPDHRPTVLDEPGVELTPEMTPPRPAVFHYHRPGMLHPHVLEFGLRGGALDGQKLDDSELALMLHNVQSGLATLRYKPGSVPESPMADLAKAEGDDPTLSVHDALSHVRAAVAAGHIHPDVERAMTRHIYEDPMVPGIGNKTAYNQFRQQGRQGVYLSMDANDFKSVNDTHGHDAGDDAIRGIGGALKDAAAHVGTGKLFRPGGDEFVAHFPTHEEALRFTRHATSKISEIPAIAGSHKLSMSVGMGTDFPSADKALYHAKDQKKDPISGGRIFPPGKTPHLAHSLVPGNEGPIQLHHETPPATHLPTPPAPSAAAPAAPNA